MCAVLYYSTDLFTGAGLARDAAKYATIGASPFSPSETTTQYSALSLFLFGLRFFV